MLGYSGLCCDIWTGLHDMLHTRTHNRYHGLYVSTSCCISHRPKQQEITYIDRHISETTKPSLMKLELKHNSKIWFRANDVDGLGDYPVCYSKFFLRFLDLFITRIGPTCGPTRRCIRCTMSVCAWKCLLGLASMFPDFGVPNPPKRASIAIFKPNSQKILKSTIKITDAIATKFRENRCYGNCGCCSTFLYEKHLDSS